MLPSLKSFPASNAHASEAFRELDLILKSTEPRERVWSQLEAFVMDELARSLDACFTASTANVAAELRALVAIAGAGSSAAARRALALPMPGRSQHSDSASPSDPLYADADDDDPLLAAHRAETAFGAALSASVSSTAAPIARGTQRELFDALAKSQVRRAHVEALRALTREWAAARQFHRIADMYHRFFHAIDMNAIAMQLDGANAGAVAPLCRALISSVLLPTAVVSELGSPFSLTYDSILPRANGGACMDAHVFLPPDVFAPSVIDDAKTIVDAAWVSPQQFTHLNRLSAADKVQLGLKFARVFAHQAKLASLHAYCRDRSNSAIQASFRDSPAVHTELSAMEAASAQVEQWLRHPSEFSARLAGLDSASAPSNQNLGDPRGLTASRTALESAATPTARPDDFESFLSASMNAPELDTADASDASVVDSTIAPRANAGVAPPMVYSAALRWAQRRLSDPEAVRSIADARKKDVFAFVNRLGAVLTSAKENDFRHRRQATVALLDGNHGDGDGVDASADQAPVAQTSSIPAQSLLAAMRVAADELDVLSLVSLKVRLMVIIRKQRMIRIALS